MAEFHLLNVRSVALLVLKLCEGKTHNKPKSTFLTWWYYSLSFSPAWYKTLFNGNKTMLGRSLMIEWRKNSWNPERVPTVSHFRVCPRATGHTFRPRNLLFGLNNPWDMRKKFCFLFFEIFLFTLFIGIFRCFSFYNTCKFLSVTVFHLGMWYLGWENLGP